MPKLISEQELVSMLRLGNQQALEYLYDNYSASLLGVLTRITRGDRFVAEDLLQETFTKIWQNRQNYDDTKGTLFTWMLTIARRLGIDKLRSSEFKERQVNQSINDFVDIDVLGSEQPFTPETSDIRSLVAGLPKEQITIIDLMYFQGYSQSEIAEEFGIPLGTVKSRARLALVALRSLFNDEVKKPVSGINSNSVRTLVLLISILGKSV
ncbi:MAG: sigma-70 family RNA polymerase sigma factor [Bacteriodetes bacterium]|nr:sigma-70 family RNA polymerase sigma factor [Bacteroidota bacterium]